MPFACEMPLGLKLLVDQQLQPVCIESFVCPRPQRRCRSGAERFAFQSRAGTGGYFTTGSSARPPLSLSLRAGDAAAAGEGSAPCPVRVQPREAGPRGRAGTALLRADLPSRAPQTARLCCGTAALRVGRGSSEREKSWRTLEDAGRMEGDAPWPGGGGK